VDNANIYIRPDELLQRLIRFNTTNPPGNEKDCILYIKGLLEDFGLDTHILSLDDNRPNLVTRLTGQGNSSPILVYGHVDVVPTSGQNWTYHPFEAKVADGCIWGRGTLDMKGGVAMMISAVLRAKAENSRLPGDVILALVSDEETGGRFGARYLVENHAHFFKDVRYALGELGGFTLHLAGKRFYPIMVSEKQVCWIKATIKGPGGHGSIPVRGGAMARLGMLLKRIDKKRLPVHVTPVTRMMIESMSARLPFPLDGVLRALLRPHLTDTVLDLLGAKARAFDPLLHNTVSPTIVRGGDKVNVIPSEIELEMDGRLLPGFGPDDLIKELKDITGPGVDIEVTLHEPGPDKVDMGFFDNLSRILKDADPGGIPVPLLLSGISDARFFSRLGIQTYGFTPMKLPKGFNVAELIHAADERIPVEAVEFGAEAMYSALKTPRD